MATRKTSRKTKKTVRRKSTRKSCTKKRKAATITVTIARLSQDVETITIPVKSTLRAALSAAGFSNLDSMLDGVRVNGHVAPLKLPLKKGDFISVAPRVQGGC